MRVAQTLIILPVLLQAGLTLVIAVLTWRQRWVGGVGQRLKHCYAAQFQLPVLFYAGAVFSYAMRIVDERVLFFATLFALAQVASAVAGLILESDKGQAAGELVCVLAAAGVWCAIALHFFTSGF